MKVLLVGEGPSERGRSDLSGALQKLVSRLAPSAKFAIDVDRVSRQDIHAHHGKGRGYKKRAVRWMLEARKRGYDALVLIIDEDGNEERTREITEAQQYEGTAIRRALGVAIRTFDAWMLADEKALASVLGCNASRQPNPETIRDPKSVCSKLLRDSESQMKPVEMYAAVAGVADLHTLESRCKKGFAPFAERVRYLQEKAESD